MKRNKRRTSLWLKFTTPILWSAVSHMEYTSFADKYRIVILRLRFLSSPLLQNIPLRQETVLVHGKDKQSL